MYVGVSSNGLNGVRRPRGFAAVPLPLVMRKGNAFVMVKVYPTPRRGMGDVPGCGPSSLSEAMSSFVQDAVDFPGQTPDPAAQALSLAQMMCNESGGGSAFGCPTMAGCDPASLQALVNSITEQVESNPTYQSATAAGTLNPGYNPPIAPGSPYAPAPTPAAPQPGPAPAAGSLPASVSFVNTSRPGQPFQVGDTWQLTVKGSPNAPVSASASQNGASMGTTPFGSTDATGTLVLNGSFSAAQVGSWLQMWTVGASPAPVLSFSVSAPAGAPAAASASSPPTGATSASAGSLTDFFSQTFSLAGFNVPVWAAGLGVVGALWLAGGHKG